MPFTIVYEPKPTMADVQALNDGLSAHARAHTGHAPIETFGFLIRDDASNLLGGCTGDGWYGCLYIGQLWLESGLRGQGYGTQLMQQAEQWGRSKGCVFAVVNTMDWEALGFYQRLGYAIEFERHGFLEGSIFYLLRKPL